MRGKRALQVLVLTGKLNYGGNRACYPLAHSGTVRLVSSVHTFRYRMTELRVWICVLFVCG